MASFADTLRGLLRTRLHPRFSYSLAGRRFRPTHEKVRSTAHRRGRTMNPGMSLTRDQPLSRGWNSIWRRACFRPSGWTRRATACRYERFGEGAVALRGKACAVRDRARSSRSWVGTIRRRRGRRGGLLPRER